MGKQGAYEIMMSGPGFAEGEDLCEILDRRVHETVEATGAYERQDDFYIVDGLAVIRGTAKGLRIDIPGFGRSTEGMPMPWLRPLQPTLHPPGTSLIRTLQGHSAAVDGVSLSGEGWLAVSASRDHTLKVWDVMRGRELRTLRGHTHWVHGVAMSWDGRLAVSASHDHTLKVWNVESGQELYSLEGHAWSVNRVALRRDGRVAVSASEDNTLKVWDLESGRELRTLRGHTRWVRDVALNDAGRLAVSASEDSTLKVWDLESGHELRTLRGI